MDKGILLNANNDVKINVLRNAEGKITRGMVVGDRKMQDAYMILSLNQGELKEDPIAGVNLLRMIRGGENREKIQKVIEIGLERANIKIDEVKEQIAAFINNNKMEL